MERESLSLLRKGEFLVLLIFLRELSRNLKWRRVILIFGVCLASSGKKRKKKRKKEVKERERRKRKEKKKLL